jgi:hypothetical protein
MEAQIRENDNGTKRAKASKKHQEDPCKKLEGKKTRKAVQIRKQKALPIEPLLASYCPCRS